MSADPSHPSHSSDRRSVAVVGSGVAGLTAAYVLQRTHDVTLYEADDRLGGHADTHDVVDADDRMLAIDTGFIVHNERTYPTLIRLLSELDVETQETEMSLSVRCDGCGLEYSGGQGIGGVVPSARVLGRPRYLRMLGEITRFHRRARALLAEGPGVDEPTLAGFLAAGGWSPYFVAHFMTPVVAAVWSCSPSLAAQYPARYLFAFLDNHGMLSVTGSPTWRTIVGGSRTYVDLVAKELAAVRLATPIDTVSRRRGVERGGVEVVEGGGERRTFDQVVIATHPDQALRLLAEPTGGEREALGAFAYSSNPAVLHTDASVLPTHERATASWNYRMASCRDTADAVQVTYDMTRLQRLDTRSRYLVSLNAEASVDPSSVVATMQYAHPQFTPRSVAAQALLPGLADGTTAFAGAYHGWGFHEDGARSGLVAAESLGGAW